MNGSFEKFILIIVLISEGHGYLLRNQTIVYEGVPNIIKNEIPHGTTNPVVSSILKTANRFYCHYDKIQNPEMIIHGVQSWAFPMQNVNLTLSYPPAARNEENVGYIITGFHVILSVDNTVTQGFITDGGILQDSISLQFTCNDVTMLAYEFWLFGIRQDTMKPEVTNVNAPIVNFMC